MFLVVGCGQPLATTAPRATGPSGQGMLRAAHTPVAPTAPSPAPTLVATPGVAATATAAPVAPSPLPTVVVVPRPAEPLSNEARWRAQQLERQVLDPRRIYVAQSPVALLWYDPVTGQTLEIGTLRGEFPAQAQFILRDGHRPALEVPYRINVDFGLTAISEAVAQRMRAAGYTESVEAYVVQSDAIHPK